MAEQKNGCKKFGCFALLAGFLFMGLVFSSGILFLIYQGFSGEGAMSASSKFGTDDMPQMAEEWSTGSGEVKAVRIPLTGMIMLDDYSPFQTGNAVSALRSIRRATCDPNVAAILLEVNSGGGGITASDILYQALKTFKQADKKRVVITLMGDVAASGAYYIALASDAIIAHPTTMTGSIGVIMQSYNIQGLAEKIGIRDMTIKSGKNKDLLNPFRAENPEQIALLQTMIDEMYGRFISLVSENRKIPIGTVKPLADGRIFTAKQALEKKLIDGIGYYADAQSLMEQKLGAAVRVYRYKESYSFSDLFFHSGMMGLSGEIKQLLKKPESALLYQVDL